MIDQMEPVDDTTVNDSSPDMEAAPDSEPVVDIWDGDSYLGDAVVRNGRWSYTVPNFGEGTHRLKATARNVESSTWVFDVNTFAMDTTPMMLDGIAVTTSLALSGRDVMNNAKVRVPTGGVLPYTYSSSAPYVATVTPAGKVTGMQNGAVTITVSDALGRSSSYSVTIRNVYLLVESTGPFNYNSALSWITSIPGSTIPNLAQMEVFLQAINTKYTGEWARGVHCWYGPTGAPSYPYGFVHLNGSHLSMSNSVDYPTVKGAVCLVLT